VPVFVGANKGGRAKSFDRFESSNQRVTVCALDLNSGGLVDRLRNNSTVVCVGVDLQVCVQVATSVRPDVIMIDSRVPRHLERLLRAHPACGQASIRWLNEPGAVARRPARGAVAAA